MIIKILMKMRINVMIINLWQFTSNWVVMRVLTRDGDI